MIGFFKLFVLFCNIYRIGPARFRQLSRFLLLSRATLKMNHPGVDFMNQFRPQFTDKTLFGHIKFHKNRFLWIVGSTKTNQFTHKSKIHNIYVCNFWMKFWQNLNDKKFSRKTFCRNVVSQNRPQARIIDWVSLEPTMVSKIWVFQWRHCRRIHIDLRCEKKLLAVQGFRH
jgi:hypothetical protein